MMRSCLWPLAILMGAAPCLADDVVVGKPAPDFVATDIDGKKVKLSKYRDGGKKNIALIFSRASW